MTAHEDREKAFDEWMDETIRQLEIHGDSKEVIDACRFAMQKTKMLVCGVEVGKMFFHPQSGMTARRMLQEGSFIPMWMIMHANGNPEIRQTLELQPVGEWVEVPLPKIEPILIEPEPEPEPEPEVDPDFIPTPEEPFEAQVPEDAPQVDHGPEIPPENLDSAPVSGPIAEPVDPLEDRSSIDMSNESVS